MTTETEALLGRYEQDGYVILRDVLDQEVIRAARRHVEWLRQRHPERRPDQLGHDLARDDPFWYRLISDSRLLDIAELFVGPDIALFSTHYICKEPVIGRAVLWHQDGGYWPLDPMEVVTLWLAITPSLPENGCMKVVPGSHRSALIEMVDAHQDSVLPKEIPVTVEDEDAVPIILEPGDVSVHHPNIVHGSEPNRSENWRCGLTIRYIPTSTRILDPSRSSAFLLRGTAVRGLNEYLPEPKPDPERHQPF